MYIRAAHKFCCWPEYNISRGAEQDAGGARRPDEGTGGQREAAVKEDGRREGFKSSAEGVTQQGEQRDREATSSGGVDVTGRSRASHSSVHWWQMMESEPSESREQRRRSSRAKRSSLNSQLILLPLLPNYERMSVRENVALCLLLLRKQKNCCDLISHPRFRTSCFNWTPFKALHRAEEKRQEFKAFFPPLLSFG